MPVVSLWRFLRGPVAALALSGLLLPGLARADDILVFAAASLKNALDDADAAWVKKGGAHVAVSYLASGPLAKQIENDAPADLFISADVDWMDYLQSKQLIRPDTRSDLLGNSLVLVAPAASELQLTIGQGFPLAASLGDGRLAIGEPQSVPAGSYGKAALEKLGVWAAVEPKLARAENVRAVLALVSRGEAPLGIVYATDAASDPGVKIVGTFPEDSHKPIIYPVAITKASKQPDTAKYLAWLHSAEAAPFFEKQGFTPIGRH
ncbi:MAG TPA: molybdate ABC transporter substrate-binding protein [Aliidongia sp.]|nr:molybdate ABC transporter substrate-binding protein [Aliidongia sp.]